MKFKQYIFILLSLCIVISSSYAQEVAIGNNEAATPVFVDTVGQLIKAQRTDYIAENYEDLTQPKTNMDLQKPDNIVTTVDYDPVSGGYILHTRIGDTEIATPYQMSAQEYRDYTERQQISKYWQEKIGEVEHDNEKKFDITDMKFNIGPADKIFGPGGVQLKLQGSAELMFAFKHQYVNNPALTERSRNNNIFDFDEKIQVNVNASVGDKMKFNMNYNTEASFAFDQQNLKLAYKGQEDDIIQSIEAGNVTMNLNSSLIKGSQALFGIKTDLKFGKLKVQALISQQNSEAQNVKSEGGAQMTKFEISADNYDENKHFFLSYYFRDQFEKAMASLPYIASGVTINRIEVWVTNKRGNYDQARNLIGFVDLGENDPSHIQNTKAFFTTGERMPQNRANQAYELLLAEPGIRDIQQVNAILQSKENIWGIQGGDDYEKVESARLLSTGEYTLNPTLGYITLKSALNQDEVLAVAFEYTYGGQVYQVGEFSTDKLSTDTLGGRAPTMILKLLKASNNAPHAYNAARKGHHYGTWDLMMKNIYSLGASTMSSDKFELYIMYKNDSVGTDLQYLSESIIKGKQLLRVMNLDRLDSKNNASPDGRFDYIEGYTAHSSTGRIMFPVLEPFGSHLAAQLGHDPAMVKKYCFQELYDSTLVAAQEMSEKNKFTLQGKYKGSNGSEIRLNAMNVPRGSVKVTAGGATLVENVDYTVDYTMGIVTILNQSIIESGTAVNVSLENQSTFSMQRKSLYGAHLEYEFNKDFTLGGTIMHMREKPLTTKVGMGSEPLANTIWGLNLNYKTEMQWLSNALDKIPWIKATAPSTFQIGAEFAHLIPGHTKDVGAEGTAYIDDFESTTTNIDVHYPSQWFLASTPSNPNSLDANRPFLKEGNRSNDIHYNSSRALLAWYVVDPIFGHPQTNTPGHIKEDVNLMSDHRTRIVYEKELYPNKDVLANEDNRMSILNLSFYPKERGPYNIDASQFDQNGELTNPKQRWGGMMRRLDNTDFEKANVEYIEFWLMDPTLTNDNYQGGDLYIDLGDISEDILRDGKKSFEHGRPVNDDMSTMDKTVWGYTPKTTSTTIAFSNEAGARDKQDVGLNGLSTAEEFAFEYMGKYPYRDFVNYLKDSAGIAQSVLDKWSNDAFSPLNDPAGDNYHYYRGDDFDEAKVSILDRYKHYNGTEGNSPESSGNREYGSASTLTPDIEDINQDNTMNEYEKYYEFHVNLRPDQMRVGLQHIAQEMTTTVTLKNGQQAEVKWYQFKIPIKGDSATCEKVGTIRNYRSIRFMRMYMTGFEDETHLRFATLDLVRGEWRNYTKGLYKNEQTGQINVTNPSGHAMLDVQAINIEENGNRNPVNYVLPPGISRQTDPGQAQLIAQNEQSMVMRIHNLPYNDALAVYKNVTYDMRNYKRLKMFVHAEQFEDKSIAEIQNGDLSCFIRLGSDMVNNYYEYEIPLSLTPAGTYNNDNQADREKVWPEENCFDFPLTVFTNAKTARNKAKRAGISGVGNTIPYVIYDDENNKPKNKITVLGNPTLEEVETIMIGVRNRNNHESDGANGEIWVNELRLSEFNEQGGIAAMANAALGISDIAQLNVTGHVETAGYGSIESNVQNRNMDNSYQVSVSAALEAGRLFPEQAKLQIPLYVSYSNNTTSPKYDPLDSDIELKETLETFNTKAEKDSVKRHANTVNESVSFSLTNLKVDIHSKKKNMFYDPANFSISASYNKQIQRTPELEKDQTTDHKGSFNYSYNFNPKPWEPFKKMEKVKKVKFISEFNIYYLPQSWAFSTNMHRTFSELKMRNFNAIDAGESNNNHTELSFSKDFTWDRNFDFKYDLTKNMKFTFQTAMNSTVEEGIYTPEIVKDYAFSNDFYEGWKDTIKHSLAKWGSPYTYQQVFTATWNVPFNRIPYLECISANASYNATYNWNRTAQANSTNTALGNTIGSTRSWQVDGGINFETLYGKSKYWKSLNQRLGGRINRQRAFKPKNYSETVSLKAKEPVEISHRLGSDNLTILVTDSAGKQVAVKTKTDGANKILITSKVDVDNVLVSIVTNDPNKRTAAQQAMDIAAYFGTMLRKVQVTYRQTNSLTVPGFYPEVGFMGQKKMGSNLYAPGWDFAFGFVPKDFYQKAKENGWLAISDSISQNATMAATSDFDYKVTLEPFPGFKIQVNGKRYTAQSNAMLYSMNAETRSTTYQENMTGSFNITQVAIKTAFDKIGKADDNYSSSTFNTFLANRAQMTNRVQERYEHIIYPNERFIQEGGWGGKTYMDTLGAVSNNSADVLVPAFLATYIGKDINRLSFDPFLSILKTMPNWSVTFDGIGRLPWFRDKFKSVTLTHAYTCKYAIGSYSTFSTWVGADGNDKTIGFTRDVTTNRPLPSGAYDISSVNLTENFSPLIGLNMSMKNSLSFKAEYRKQRNLALNVTSVQLTEGHTNEFVIGAGYTVKDLNFTAKTKNGGQKKVSNDLKLNVDVSYKDIKTLLRKIDENITQASSGNKVFGIKISADYVLSQKINLQLFYDHQGTTPLISSSYPVKSDNVGINVKLMLTR